MKQKIKFLIFSIVYVSLANAQTYREMFDKMDQTVEYQNGRYSMYSNLQSGLHLIESSTMRAYINMYKATHLKL